MAIAFVNGYSFGAISPCQRLFIINSSVFIKRSVGIVAIVAVIVVIGVVAMLIVPAAIVMVMMAKSKDHFESSALWRIFYFFCGGFNLERVSFCLLTG